MKFSNVGYKITYALTPGGTGAIYTTIPFHHGFTNAASVKTDIGSAYFTSLINWDHTTHTFKSYIASLNNFSIIGGESYKLTTKTAPVTWVVCGYSLPSDVITLYGPDPDKNYVSFPPDIKPLTASQLFAITPGASSIQRTNLANELISYTASGGTDFDITLFSSYWYIIYVDADTTIKPEVY